MSTKGSDPLVSVILPVYNVESYLPAALDSLQRQSLRDLEILLIEDGSTDNTREIVRQAELLPLVRAVYHPSNQGLSAARNTGIEAARGRYIGFVDGDDLAHPDMFRNMAAAAEENDVEIVTCGYSRFVEGDESESANAAPFRFPVGRRIADSALKSLLERGHRDKLYWFNPLFMYSRELVTRMGLRFDLNVPMGVDTVFNSQALHSAKSIFAVPEHLYVVRHRVASMTRHGTPEWNKRISLQYRALRSFYEREALWSSAAPDYFRYVVEHSLPQAIANSCLLAESRSDLARLLRDLRECDWVSDALRQQDIWRGLPTKQLLVSRLLESNMSHLVALLYSRRTVAHHSS